MASAKFSAREHYSDELRHTSGHGKGAISSLLNAGTWPLKTIVKGSFKALAKMANVVGGDSLAKKLNVDEINELTLSAKLRTMYGQVDEVTTFMIYVAARNGDIKVPEYVSNPVYNYARAKLFKSNPEKLSELNKYKDMVYYPKMTSEEAIRFAEKFSFTYYELPKAWRVARNIVNPFISFVYNAGKITKHALTMYPMRTAFMLSTLSVLNERLENSYGIGLSLNTIIPGLDWTERFTELYNGLSGDSVPTREESFFNAPLAKWAYIVYTGTDPFTGERYDSGGNRFKRIIPAYTQAMIPMPPLPDLAVRLLFYSLDKKYASEQYYDLFNSLTGRYLSQSWLSRKVIDQGLRGQAVDYYKTQVSPMLSYIYALSGLNVTVKDQIKLSAMLDARMNQLEQQQAKLDTLKVTPFADRPGNKANEIRVLKDDIRKTKLKIAQSMEDMGIPVPTWVATESTKFFGTRLVNYLVEYFADALGFEIPTKPPIRSWGRP